MTSVMFPIPISDGWVQDAHSLTHADELLFRENWNWIANFKKVYGQNECGAQRT